MAKLQYVRIIGGSEVPHFSALGILMGRTITITIEADVAADDLRSPREMTMDMLEALRHPEP